MYDIRVAMMQMGQMIMLGDHDLPGGLAGHLVMETFSWYKHIFNYTFVWVPYEDRTLMGYRKPDGNYTGIMRLLAEDRADMCLFPLPIVPETEAFDIGPAIMSMPTVITSVMDVRQNEDNVLKQLFRFTIEIIVLLVVSVYVLAYVLTKSERFRPSSVVEQSAIRETDVKFLNSLWYLIALMSLQPNYEPKTLPGTLLIVITSIGVFFWYAIWGNLMTSDTVSYDSTRTINNLEDVIRMNSTLYMVSSDPASRLLEIEAEANPNSLIGRVIHNHTVIWRMSENDQNTQKAGDPRALAKIRAEIGKLNDTVFLNKGVMSLQVLIDQFQSILCKYRSGNTTKWNHPLQVTTDSHLPYSPFQPWYNKKLDPVIKKAASHAVTKVNEGGLLRFIYERCNEIVEKLLEITVKGECVKRNADEYINELMMDGGDIRVSVERVSDVFTLLAGCLCLCAVVLGIEKTRIGDSVQRKYEASMENLKVMKAERKLRKAREKIEKIIAERKREAERNGVAFIEELHLPQSFKVGGARRRRGESSGKRSATAAPQSAPSGSLQRMERLTEVVT